MQKKMALKKEIKENKNVTLINKEYLSATTSHQHLKQEEEKNNKKNPLINIQNLKK